MGGTGTRNGPSPQHDHRRAGLFRSQHQPTAGSQVVLGQAPPCFQQDRGQAGAARRIQPDLQQGRIVPRLGNQQTRRVHTLPGQPLSIKLHAHRRPARKPRQQERFPASLIHRGKDKGHRRRKRFDVGINLMQVPLRKPGNLHPGRYEGRLMAGMGWILEHRGPHFESVIMFLLCSYSRSHVHPLHLL